jgi:hypothetical protein
VASFGVRAGWRANPACIDAAHRLRARVEVGIRTRQGLRNRPVPSRAMAMNKARFHAALIAAALLAWLRLLALDGTLARAEPRRPGVVRIGPAR